MTSGQQVYHLKGNTDCGEVHEFPPNYFAFNLLIKKINYTAIAVISHINNPSPAATAAITLWFDSRFSVLLVEACDVTR